MASKKTRDEKVVDLETDTHTCRVSVTLAGNGHAYATILDNGEAEKRWFGLAMSKPPRTFSTGSVFREPDGTVDMILMAVPHQGAGRKGPGDRWMYFANQYHEAVGPSFEVNDQKAVTQAEIDERFGVGKVVPHDD